MQPPSINSAVSALRFFFTATLDRPDLARRLTVVPYPRRIPAVPLYFGAVVARSGHFLDAELERGKGRKDRHAMLSPQLLELLRIWWREGRRRTLLLPGGWLFPGRNENRVGDRIKPGFLTQRPTRPRLRVQSIRKIATHAFRALCPPRQPHYG